jgi:hypothetical protein
VATNKYQVVECLSDISGEKGATTTTYAINGQSYSIDLTETETKEFQDILAPYIAVSAVGKKRGPRLRSTPEETAAIVKWARANGHALTPAGRVPTATRRLYLEQQAEKNLRGVMEAESRRPVKKAPAKKATAKKAVKR